jgi:hypothetical protein
LQFLEETFIRRESDISESNHPVIMNGDLKSVPSTLTVGWDHLSIEVFYEKYPKMANQNNRQFDLVAIDCDGTLLDSQKNVSKGAREAIDRARAAGMQIIPISVAIWIRSNSPPMNSI